MFLSEERGDISYELLIAVVPSIEMQLELPMAVLFIILVIGRLAVLTLMLL
jgi:hypothetical protein